MEVRLCLALYVLLRQAVRHPFRRCGGGGGEEPRVTTRLSEVMT